MFGPIPPRPEAAEALSRSDGPPPLDPRTEEELRACVGPRADYYLRKWRPLLSGTGGDAGVNIAAFLFGGFWLGYRKMYRAMLILAGVVLAGIALEGVLFLGLLQMPEPPSGLAFLVGLVIAVVCGVCGNRWYLAHVRRIVAEVRAEELEEPTHLRIIARRGGTSWIAPIGLLVLLAVAGSVLSFALMVLFGPVERRTPLPERPVPPNGGRIVKEQIDAIKAVPHFRTFNCEGCDTPIRVHALQMYGSCPGCQAHHKARGFGEIGCELEDVVDAVLEWAGMTRDEVRARHEARERGQA